MKPLGPVCRLESVELGMTELRPGQSMRLGRHRDNDLVLQDSSVSRFHARIAWDRQVGCPILYDNGSQNGTQVDGQAVEGTEPLRDGSRLVIGPFVFKVEVRGVDSDPALLKETSDLVTLFSDDGPAVRGEFGGAGHSLPQVLNELETGRRTGTLRLEFPGGHGSVVFCLGRIMAADVPGHGRRTRALERVLDLETGRFEFSRDLEPQEEAMNLWLSDYLRARAEDTGNSTSRMFRGDL